VPYTYRLDVYRFLPALTVGTHADGTNDALQAKCCKQGNKALHTKTISVKAVLSHQHPIKLSNAAKA
jgi:hypothetical protein